MRFFVWPVCLLCCACSKPDKAPSPAPTEPWPAQAASSDEAPSLATAYRIEERGQARFSLKGRDGTPSGEIRVARGELQVHLADLSHSTGTIAMDVASVRMLESGDAGIPAATTAARNWLNVGSNRPEPEIERTRWASFEITRIDEVSADSATLGRKVKPPPVPASDAGADANTPSPAEARSVRLIATGALSFNGLRVERRVALEVTFLWRAGQSTTEPPQQLSIKSRRPMLLELAAHEVAPRDDTGRRTTTEDHLLGRSVGREARVELDLSAKLVQK